MYPSPVLMHRTLRSTTPPLQILPVPATPTLSYCSHAYLQLLMLVLPRVQLHHGGAQTGSGSRTYPIS